MKTIYIASTNAHKLEEIQSILPADFLLKGLKDLEIEVDIPETGKTLEENALLKANYLQSVINNSDAIVIADDSGLEVEALDGKPGVYSARYAGEEKNDKENNKKLLDELQNKTNRKAKFVTIIALVEKNKQLIFKGEVKGTIAFVPKGEHGFGYDPLFIPQGYRSTFAELGEKVKSEISHRAMAVNKLLAYLNN
ncbi:MAG: RdgB/HAM1 family non-canonical purine NTP pyrophosphatase [Sphingobacteriaceae bacterium]|nr:RdgB/HAM1 family non-canonical purine NTP pyrophosphatase [Sphingobacteriaceae bacterium]